ncbi:MAG: fumarylacetoacetase [Rhodoferax sp.]|uniref:fumarylacetoacetase n=1 Tax=Rhodoferax sp. TaxID=50421 RepID=UPI0032655BCC
MLNETHDPGLRSWVLSAQQPGTDFPLQNLPYCVFRRSGSQEAWRGGVAIGDTILDMAAAYALGVFSSLAAEAAQTACASTLNGLMALGPSAWSALRLALSRLLRDGAPEAAQLQACLVAQVDAEYAVSAGIGDYTDFFTSQHHALNAGRIFQPQNALLPNFKWLPIGYHGRASTVAISGTAVARPHGQTRAPEAAAPRFGPTQGLDYEVELGIFVGPGNPQGTSIALDDAEDHAFGLCLLNDWSARDVQAWESMPLGPFMAKNFLTSVSPWIVTLEALAPFRVPLPREATDPPALPYLQSQQVQAFDIQLEAWLTPQGEVHATRLSHTSYRHAYWSVAHMLAQHTSNGCALLPGDLLGTGTQSGPQPGEEGCLLELTRGGQNLLTLPSGVQRGYLQDGDSVLLRGVCERAGFARIGFGECHGQIVPARPAIYL